jgi:EAL domain-containing protein (putative c-di-GMP-specific phosphodiesterase class I)
VNLSAHQLNESGLLEAFEREIASSGVDPALLCVEITETVLLRETETVRANLDGIHALGVRIAADDFGTGYASLAYLRSYPIDVVKIDRSFVSDITTNPVDEHLVEGVVALAERLGMSVTVEGVETAEQALLVRRLGCTGAQGWLYSKAVPADEITERWLTGPIGA